MKRCPQCNSVFENDIGYCPKDGTALIDENFSLPSADKDFEADTIIRRDQIVVDLSPPDAPAENLNYQAAPVVEKVIVREVPAKSSSRNAAVYLVFGLILGGILVLGTLLIAREYYSADATNDNSRQIDVNISATKPQNSPPGGGRNENKSNLTETASLKHAQPTAADEEEFNGRVIALNAYVRASPNRTAAQTDVLPLNDRIDIERREDESSPWYYISCEHGASGWMHGDTIEYTR